MENIVNMHWSAVLYQKGRKSAPGSNPPPKTDFFFISCNCTEFLTKIIRDSYSTLLMEMGLLHDYFGNYSTRGEKYYFRAEVSMPGEIKPMLGKIEMNLGRWGQGKLGPGGWASLGQVRGWSGVGVMLGPGQLAFREGVRARSGDSGGS